MSAEKNYKLRKFGPTTKRRDYSVTKHTLPVSDLISIQTESFKWFIEKGLDESFRNIYPIESTNGRIRIEYLPKTLRVELPKEGEFAALKEARQKGITYSAKVFAKLRKIDEQTAEVKDSEVLFGEIPYMTSGGSFIINGSEKVIVSQLLRSPGVYLSGATRFKAADHLFNRMEIIPKMGLWMDIFHRVTTSTTDWVRISIDKTKAQPFSTFLRAFGMTKDTIIEYFGNSPEIQATLKKDNVATEEEALEWIHRILRRGDRITADSKKNLFASLMFNQRRYNLSKTGRYLLNRKLNLVERINGTILAEDLKTSTGAVLFKKGTEITFDMAVEIQRNFEDKVFPRSTIKDISTDIYGSQLESFPKLKKRNKIIIVNVWKTIDDMNNNAETIKVIANDFDSTEHHLLVSDIIAAVSYYFNFNEGLGLQDDPDSLTSKRIVAIGELLQNQFQIGLSKIEKNAKERMSAREVEKITPKNITNNKAIYTQFKTFFNSSQLSQFMDQINPLAEISNKRRITSLGPGGLNRGTATAEMRDVHSTHYGRICPIETPEGPNIGLILNYANYARINSLGFIETAYYPVKDGVVSPEAVWISAFDEEGKTFAQSSLELDKNNKIIDKEITVRCNGEYKVIKSTDVDYIDVSSKQISSIAASAIPFLENDDANRALMGANMQRQAVPLLKSEAPLVATGIEADIAKFSSVNIRATGDGEVKYVDSELIKVKQGSKNVSYQLKSFDRSNQGSVISQRPIVEVGQIVKKGELLTDGPSFDKGELAIGKNVTVAFTTWNGYNYEDAIILSERLVKDDVYTSLHIEEHIAQFRKSKAGDDRLTNEIPNVSTFSKRNLDERGIVVVGSEVVAGDILVGRVSPKGEENPTPEEKLIAAIFSQKVKNEKDTSLKVKHGHSGTVIGVEILSHANGDKLQDGIDKIVKVSIAKKRKIKVGDKMAGRHGNKGVISRVLPVEDMPHLADGTPIDIMLNPQGVPSRMNIGQVLELHLGMAAKELGVKFVSPVFDGIKYENIIEVLKEANLPEDGKFDLYDPISGKKFDSKVSVGVMYMLKLAHMIDDKMHARSVGPYSLITQQPLGGKSQNGGQRFGEMETWAVESYGATHVLQELLTYKSDNIEGRNKVYNAIANGGPLPEPGTPESFNVLAYELRGLGMKLGVKVNEKKGRK